MALNGIDRSGHRFRRGDISEPPTRHRVGFAESVNRDRQIVSLLRERRDADVFRIVINQFFVDLVGQDVDVFLRRDLNDRFQFLAAVDGTARIARAVPRRRLHGK